MAFGSNGNHGSERMLTRFGSGLVGRMHAKLHPTADIITSSLHRSSIESFLTSRDVFWLQRGY